MWMGWINGSPQFQRTRIWSRAILMKYKSTPKDIQAGLSRFALVGRRRIYLYIGYQICETWDATGADGIELGRDTAFVLKHMIKAQAGAQSFVAILLIKICPPPHPPICTWSAIKVSIWWPIYNIYICIYIHIHKYIYTPLQFNIIYKWKSGDVSLWKDPVCALLSEVTLSCFNFTWLYSL